VGEQTGIDWTDHTFNPWIGCARVSPGCQHCYAEAQQGRHHVVWGVNGTRRVTSDAYWREPLRWNRIAEQAGRPALVFCASLADVFEDRPDIADTRERLWELIGRTPHLIWQLLTKRPENIAEMVPVTWRGWRRLGMDDVPAQWPSNVWIGTTVEDQQRAVERIPHLLAIPAPVRFLSCEPMLGHVDINWALNGDSPCWEGPTDDVVHWVICGGESGPGHRRLNLDHARDLRDDCDVAGVPFFFKQVGGPRPKSGGVELDGQIHHEFPAEARR
jgi:protein gp37